MATLAEALSIALDLHQAGRLDEAETLYRRILTAAPGQPDALHLSGVLAGQRGRTDQGIALIQKAIALTPSAADCRINLADLLRRTGRLAQAAALYRQALTLRPDRDDALAALALTAARLGSGQTPATQAANWYRLALAIRPDFVDVVGNLIGLCEADAALTLLSRRIRLRADTDALAARAARRHQTQDSAGAQADLRAALALAPDRADLWQELGESLHGDEAFSDAVSALSRAAALAPHRSPVRPRLGLLLRTVGRLAEAADQYRRVLADNPDHSAVRSALWEVERALGLHAAYHGHEGQDAFVHRTFFPDRTGGVFLDIGAYDGVTWSNTLFFERELGWTGLCVEASPTRFAALARNRPGPNLNIALANREGEAEFLDILDGPAMMGGLSETFDPGQRAFVDTLIHDKRLITVPVRRLGAVLAEHGITHVQYCSIDTEGAERSIIESIDFSRVTIDVFSLENPPEDPGLRALMDGLGYERVCRFFGGDEVYARRGLHRHPPSPASSMG
ncbi:FkbM family methyltransferase [Azospirillum griseum]|uniref:FkbM family methyltransferase n=1 Tax=Azospirillum griseum TaxID=2496639 RepID=A0A431VNG5_9PROT|nr:FkbM family methyltransferase [Azospirillum griseum]RTR24304.1 FkbM family methyltransferase [Azospirillum griseum]